MAKLTLIDELGNLKADKQNYNEIVPPADNSYYLSAPEYNKLLATLKELIADYNILKLSSSTFDTYDIIKSGDDATVPTDSHLYTARKTAEEIRKLVDILDFSDYYLSKRSDDSADGKITFNKGMDIGSYQEGMRGGHINQNADAELKSLKLREWLEVPELRFNRVEVQMGDKWRSPGGGIIESVDTENQIITLKLEQGEYGAVALNDLCMGIFHSMIPSNNSTESTDDSRNNRTIKGFSTSYFKVEELLNPQENNSRFRYSLRPISPRHNKQVHPEAFMNFAAFGNTTNPDRQTSSYETRTYQRYLINMNDWEITVMNVAAQYGDLSNLNSLGLPPMSGYSVYLKNVYFSGNLQQIKAPKIEDGTWWTWNGEKWVNSGVPATGIPKDGIYSTLSNSNLSILRGSLSYEHTWAEMHVYEGNRELTYVESAPLTQRGTYTVNTVSSGVTPGHFETKTVEGKTFFRITPISYIDEQVNSALITYKVTGIRFDGTAFNFSTTQTFTKVDSGKDGKDVEYIYARTKNSIPPILPIDSLNEDGYVPPADGEIVWTPDPVGVTDIWEYEWYAKREKINGVWSSWRNLLQWRYHAADGHDGKDGDNREYIFITNNDKNFNTYSDSRPTMIVQSDDFIPKTNSVPSWNADWSDEPVDPGPDQMYEWYCYRDKTGGEGGVGGLWGAFKGPYLWTKYPKDGADGDGGESASLLYLSSSSQLMTTNTSNVPHANQTISIEAKVQYAPEPITFAAKAYNSSNSFIENVTLANGSDSNTKNLTSALWKTTYKKVVVTATISARNLTDTITIYRLSDASAGQDGIFGFLTNESITFPASYDEVVDSSIFNTDYATGKLEIFEGTQLVTSSVTYSVHSKVGCDVTINSSGLYRVTSLNYRSAHATIRGVYKGVTIDRKLTLSKSPAGMPGPPGVGVPIVFRGTYRDDVEYYGNNTRVDIVKYKGWYYRTKETVGTIMGISPIDPSTLSDYWYSFGASFDSVATNLLLAEKANIAGFVYKDLVMQSQIGVSQTGEEIDLMVYNPIPDDLVFIPNLKLDGTKGTLSIRDKIQLFSDGSGYVANNNFKWDTEGNISLGSTEIGKYLNGSIGLLSEFSKDGEGNWHSIYKTEDSFMRTKIVQGNNLWSEPVRIVKSIEYNFANSTNGTTAPVTSSTSWQDVPREVPSGSFMWIRSRTITHNNQNPDTAGSWSTPFVATSENTEFAKTSALEWSGEFITGDSFMRLKTGQTWSKAINIKPLIEYQFRNNTSATSPPTSWYDVPYSLTANGEHMWMRTRTRTYLPKEQIQSIPEKPYNVGSWSSASRITGDTGYNISSKIYTSQFNVDGSGYLAGGNISWDSLGNTTFTGTVKTNYHGKSIILNPNSSELAVTGESGEVAGRLFFNNSGATLYLSGDYGPGTRWMSGGITLGGSQLKIGTGENNLDGLSIDPYSIKAHVGSTGFDFTINDNTLHINLKGLSSSGSYAGEVYDDSNGFLKIVK